MLNVTHADAECRGATSTANSITHHRLSQARQCVSRFLAAFATMKMLL
jgi:hypothetical protein